MAYVVSVLSWAGWIWTACFFAIVVPLLWREALREARLRDLDLAASSRLPSEHA
jgi:uncharacterized membrane protein